MIQDNEEQDDLLIQDNEEQHDLHELDDADKHDLLFSQFEDAIQDEHSDSGHSLTVKVDGKTMFKSSVVRLISSGMGLKKSGDRLRRVQGLSRFMLDKSGNVPLDEDSNNVIALKDPIATICSTKGCLSLAVMFVERIDHEKRRVSFVPRESPEAFLSGKPIPLKAASGDSHLKFKIGQPRKAADMKCALQMSVPLEMTINDVNYQFSITMLEEIF